MPSQEQRSRWGTLAASPSEERGLAEQQAEIDCEAEARVPPFLAQYIAREREEGELSAPVAAILQSNRDYTFLVGTTPLLLRVAVGQAWLSCSSRFSGG